MSHMNTDQMKTRIAITVSIIIAAVIGISTWSIISERQHVIATAERQTAGYARALSEHTESAFTEASRVLDHTIYEIGQKGGVKHLSARSLFDLIRRQIGNSPQIAAIFLADEHGNMFMNSLEFPPRQINVSDRDYFRHYKDTPGANLTVSKPVMSRLVGRWRYNLMRPLNQPGERFQGLMAVVFEVEYFKSFFNPASLGPRGLVMLIRGDGSPLVYEPYIENAYARTVSSSELFREYLPNVPAGTYQVAQSGIDGAPRIVSFQKLSRYPVVALVALHRDDLLRPWMHKAVLQASLTLALSMVIVVLMFHLFRHLDSLKAVGEDLRIKAAQIDAANDVIMQVDSNGKIIQFNQALAHISGYGVEELKLMHLQDIEKPECETLSQPVLNLLDEVNEAIFESSYLSREGRSIPVEVHSRKMKSDGRSLVLSIVRDVTERKRSELREVTRLRILEEMATGVSLDKLLSHIVRFVEQQCEGAICSILVTDEEGKRLRHGAAPSLPDWYNTAVDGLMIKQGAGSCGTAAFLRKRVIVEDIESHPYWKGFLPARRADLRSCWSEPILSTEGELLGTFAMYYRFPSSPRPVELTLIESAAHLASLAISRVRGEMLQNRLESQLRQIQKIEAIGQLAGGVAHDFNNLLTPIIGYAEMIRDRFDIGDSIHKKAEAIMMASLKARELTSSLLSFSRRQMLCLEPLDLNEIVASFQVILGPTIRENIHISIAPARDRCIIRGDRGQIEQVILNLAVNAQDAISGTGHIAIEIDHHVIDEEFARMHPGMRPGKYVQLLFSDDGCGMNDEVLTHIFEPFFTTKQVGHGTGLGLATVYGIVKQHEGYVAVSSIMGKGTTFRVYLPSFDEKCAVAPPQPAAEPTGTLLQNRTYMVVEDNDMVREMISEMLKKSGSTVLVSGLPSAAIEISETYGNKIDLLITDVVMPEMNGQELYKRITSGRPDMRVLFISGYTDNVFAEQEGLEEQTYFLPKPFTSDQFLKMTEDIFADCA